MNRVETINILCGTDNNYAPYYGIMLTSLFECNKEYAFDVYVFVSGDLSEVNRKKFKKLEQKYGDRIVLMTIDADRLKDCPVRELDDSGTCAYLNQTAYYRLLAAELLPASVKKIIYLDGDIVINGDVRPLWNVDLTDKAIACVGDCDVADKEIEKRLGYAPDKGYFNAGVAVYNLDYWRKERVSDRIFAYIKERKEQLKYMDQDAVNGVLWAEKVLLPERFNFQTPYFAPYFWIDYTEDFRRALLDECKKAVVIHYCCALKVWDFRYWGGPFYAVWNKYRKMSFWRNAHIIRPLRTYGKFLFNRLLNPNKLKKQRRSIWVVLPENEMCY